MGKMSKNKGKVGEREFAHLLSNLGVEAKRGVQYQGGEESPDVVHALEGIHFEVKRSEQLSMYKALAQADNDSGLYDVPVVAHRKNNKPWVVVLYAEDFINLAREPERE